jgi:hypothetical protein
MLLPWCGAISCATRPANAILECAMCLDVQQSPSRPAFSCLPMGTPSVLLVQIRPPTSAPTTHFPPNNSCSFWAPVRPRVASPIPRFWRRSPCFPSQWSCRNPATWTSIWPRESVQSNELVPSLSLHEFPTSVFSCDECLSNSLMLNYDFYPLVLYFILSRPSTTQAGIVAATFY